MTERQEEQAALHAVYSLDAHERQILRAELRTDPRLRVLAAELEEAANQIALLLPAEAPPEEDRALFLRRLKQHRRAKVTSFGTTFRILRQPWVGWAVAACLAVVAWNGYRVGHELTQEMETLIKNESTARSEAASALSKVAGLEKNLADATEKSQQFAGEINNLKQMNVFAHMEVTSLRATVRKFEEGAAVIVWDNEKQEGQLKLEKMPPVQANRDYQLWVFDKKNPAPISAGVIKVDARGMATVTFKPVEPVPSAAKFAISIEAIGGVAKKSADGPVIFAGPQ
ncbi:MAG: anti-sigma factor [Verrucomicrobia bacterium]|nr:anti-sigma factor [Verrucomicrobiota bacterium]